MKCVFKSHRLIRPDFRLGQTTGLPSYTPLSGLRGEASCLTFLPEPVPVTVRGKQVAEGFSTRHVLRCRRRPCVRGNAFERLPCSSLALGEVPDWLPSSGPTALQGIPIRRRFIQVARAGCYPSSHGCSERSMRCSPCWCARQDSNLQPRDYESPAPPLSYRRTYQAPLATYRGSGSISVVLCGFQGAHLICGFTRQTVVLRLP